MMKRLRCLKNDRGKTRRREVITKYRIVRRYIVEPGVVTADDLIFLKRGYSTIIRRPKSVQVIERKIKR